MCKEFLRRCRLDDFPCVHHGASRGDLRSQRQVVRDEEDSRLMCALQLRHEADNLLLDGDIQSRRRLIGDEDVGGAGDCHGDHDALP